MQVSVTVKVLTASGTNSTRTLSGFSSDTVASMSTAKELAEAYLKLTTATGKSYAMVTTQSAEF